MASKFYAVKQGKIPGIYRSWADCSAQVQGFSGAIYKSFPTLEEAEAFMGNAGASVNKARKTAVGNRVNTANSVSSKEEHIENNVPDMNDILKNPDKEEAVAYVDGSYYHPTKEFSLGAVIAYKGEEHHFSEKFADPELASMRNVAGEIKGAECAMQFAIDHGCSNLYIYHDYEGIARWCLGEWKANKEGTKAYKAFYENASQKVKIHFVKVKGHSNDTYNDLADELAKQALGLL